MSFLDKLRAGNGQQSPSRISPARFGHAATAVARASVSAPPGPGYAPRTGRQSNGLKEFLWTLDGIGHGHLLDLGPAWQNTIMFFLERGFKVYTEDLLAAWKDFLDADAKRIREQAANADPALASPSSRAERFLAASLRYPDETFDAVLMWDLLDYLDEEMSTRVVTRVTSLVREGGAVLAIFHNRKPEGFHRYRVLDGQHVELVSAPSPLAAHRIYQNREISNFFMRFHSSKSFVGRDQLRENLFVK